MSSHDSLSDSSHPAAVPVTVKYLHIRKHITGSYARTALLYGNQRQCCPIIVDVGFVDNQGLPVYLSETEAYERVRLAEYISPTLAMRYSDTAPNGVAGWIHSKKSRGYTYTESTIQQVAALSDDIRLAMQLAATSTDDAVPIPRQWITRSDNLHSPIENEIASPGESDIPPPEFEVMSPTINGYRWNYDFFSASLKEAALHGIPNDRPWNEPPVHDEGPSRIQAALDTANPPALPDAIITNSLTFYVYTSTANHELKLCARVTDKDGKVWAHTANRPSDDADIIQPPSGVGFHSYIVMKSIRPWSPAPGEAGFGYVQTISGGHKFTRTKGSWKNSIGFSEAWIQLDFNNSPIDLNWMKEGSNKFVWMDGGKSDGIEWSVWFITNVNASNYIFESSQAHELKGSTWPNASHGKIATHAKSRNGDTTSINLAYRRPYRLIIGCMTGSAHWLIYNSSGNRHANNQDQVIEIVDTYGTSHRYILRVFNTKYLKGVIT